MLHSEHCLVPSKCLHMNRGNIDQNALGKSSLYSPGGRLIFSSRSPRLETSFGELLYVEERPWWSMHSPNNGRERKMKGEEEREIGPGLLILELNEDKF